MISWIYYLAKIPDIIFSVFVLQLFCNSLFHSAVSWHIRQSSHHFLCTDDVLPVKEGPQLA